MVRIYLLIITGASAALILGRLFADGPYPDTYLGAFSDDFFYYLETAKNLAEGRGSTFDGETTTNGYHPLWMLTLSSIWYIFASEWNSFLALGALSLALNLLTAILAWRIFGPEDAPRPVRLAAVGLTQSSHSLMACTGMETTLAIPLALATLLLFRRVQESPAPRRVFALFLTGGLMALSRLDTVLLLGPLSLHLLLEARYRWRMSGTRIAHLTGVALLGTLPLLVYILLNVHFFGHAVPVSGAAKQLQGGLMLSQRGLSSIVDNILDYRSPLKACLPAGAALVGLLGLVRGGRDSIAGSSRFLHPLLFSFLLFGSTLFRSDWLIWSWYYYPFCILLPSALVFAYRAVSDLPVLRRARVLEFGPLFLSVGFLTLLYTRSYSKIVAGQHLDPIYLAAKEIEAFAEQHPGRYGMGDRAGVVGYLLPNPVVQLEGLITDGLLLELIDREAPLTEAFRRYRIDYYISARDRVVDGCYELSEPKEAQAGRSRRMRLRLCEEPVFSYTGLRDGHTTRIFDVRALSP